MTAAQSTLLTPWVIVVAVIFWTAAGIAVRATLAEPHPARFLIESAFEKVMVAVMVTVYAVVFWNTDHGYPLFDLETARVLSRGAPILLVAKPVVFILAYVFNWFHDEDYREAGRSLSR